MNDDIVDTITTTKPKRRSRGVDYVNNKDLSVAVIEFAEILNIAKANDTEHPQPTNYIAESILKISNGLSRSPSYINYPYREDMMMDGVVDCLKALKNFNVNAVTRGGAPNAFGYFTQICYYAFLRRIAKEKKQLEIKMKMIENGSIGSFMDTDDDCVGVGENIVERVRRRNASFYDSRKETISDSSSDLPKSKIANRRVAKAARTGPLSDFIN